MGLLKNIRKKKRGKKIKKEINILYIRKKEEIGMEIEIEIEKGIRKGIRKGIENLKEKEKKKKKRKKIEIEIDIKGIEKRETHGKFNI